MNANINRSAACRINPLIQSSQAETLQTLAGIVYDFGDLLSRHPELSGFVLCIAPAVSGALEFEAAEAKAREAAAG